MSRAEKAGTIASRASSMGCSNSRIFKGIADDADHWAWNRGYVDGGLPVVGSAALAGNQSGLAARQRRGMHTRTHSLTLFEIWELGGRTVSQSRCSIQIVYRAKRIHLNLASAIENDRLGAVFLQENRGRRSASRKKEESGRDGKKKVTCCEIRQSMYFTTGSGYARLESIRRTSVYQFRFAIFFRPVS